MAIELRDASSDDHLLIARVLYTAWQWRHRWDEDAFQQHVASRSPDSYVDDFGGRAGDAGLIAEERAASGCQFAGAAWYRFFSTDEQRAGFVAEDVPELVVAVEEGMRGRGVGRRLMQSLLNVAAKRGIRALSLHVSGGNTPAFGLYRSVGFDVTRGDEGRGAVMVNRLCS